jgi:hypothetical protein
MSDIKNLWPDDLLKGSDMLLPITILQEQARFLNEMTRNIVIATVDTRTVAIAIGKNSNETKPGILHTLKIVAPAIGSYDFELARLVQEELLPYPLRIFAPLTEQKFEINNSEELEFALSKIFNDKKTIATIQSLIIQSRQ